MTASAIFKFSASFEALDLLLCDSEILDSLAIFAWLKFYFSAPLYELSVMILFFWTSKFYPIFCLKTWFGLLLFAYWNFAIFCSKMFLSFCIVCFVVRRAWLYPYFISFECKNYLFVIFLPFSLPSWKFSPIPMSSSPLFCWLKTIPKVCCSRLKDYCDRTSLFSWFSKFWIAYIPK